MQELIAVDPNNGFDPNGMSVGMHLPVTSTASKVSNFYEMNASSKFCKNKPLALLNVNYFMP